MFLIGRTSNKALVPSLLLGGECKGNPMNCNFLGKCESFDIRDWKRDHKNDKYYQLLYDITHYLFTHPIFFWSQKTFELMIYIRSSHHT